MDRDALPQELDETLDRPDPWGDIPDLEAAEDAPEEAPSTHLAAAPEPTIDAPEEKKGRGRRRKERSKPAPVEEDRAPDEEPIPTAEPWAPDASTVDAPSDEVATGEDATQPEPTEFVAPTPIADPPEITAAPAVAETPPSDASPSVPPWPDRSLDVLPYADRSAWPGARDQGEPNQTVSATAQDGPPEPATDPMEADVDAYTLPPPRPAL